MRNKSLLLLAGLALLGVAHPAGRMLGQAVYGSIIGTVTDSSGAAVPNAKVTITNVDKGVIVTTTTHESGNYEQQHLIVGTYDVKVEAPGFQASVQKAVQVNVDAAVQVNATLQLGQVTQTVEVTAAVPMLKTERTDHKQYLTRDQARADVFDYIERFYNPRRRHSTLGYISPIEFERQALLA